MVQTRQLPVQRSGARGSLKGCSLLSPTCFSFYLFKSALVSRPRRAPVVAAAHRSAVRNVGLAEQVKTLYGRVVPPCSEIQACSTFLWKAVWFPCCSNNIWSRCVLQCDRTPLQSPAAKVCLKELCLCSTGVCGKGGILSTLTINRSR